MTIMNDEQEFLGPRGPWIKDNQSNDADGYWPNNPARRRMIDHFKRLVCEYEESALTRTAIDLQLTTIFDCFPAASLILGGEGEAQMLILAFEMNGEEIPRDDRSRSHERERDGRERCDRRGRRVLHHVT